MDGITKPQQDHSGQTFGSAPRRSFITEAEQTVARNTARNERDIRNRIEEGKKRFTERAPARSFITEARESVATNTARNNVDIRNKIEKGKQRMNHGAAQTLEPRSGNFAISPSGTEIRKVQPSPKRTAKRRRGMLPRTPMQMAARAAMRRGQGKNPRSNKKKVSMPYPMLIFALMIDTLEFISFGLLGLFTTPIFFATFGLWFISKGKVVRKNIWRRIKTKFIVSSVVESLPISGLAPLKSYMIWTVYQNEKIVS